MLTFATFARHLRLDNLRIGISGLMVQNFVDEFLRIEARSFGNAHFFRNIYEFNLGLGSKF